MATINELVTSWGFEIKDDSLKKLENIQNGFSNIGNAAEKLGKMFTGGKGIVEYFREFIGGANQLKNLSIQTGYSTEAIQKWQYAARAMGVDANNVISSLGQLKNQYAIGEKEILKWADTFKKSGRWYAHQVGSEMGMTEDLINMLLQGSETVKKFLEESSQVGAVLSESDIDKSAQMYRELDKNLYSLSKTTDQVMAKVVPDIDKAAKAFNDWLGDKPDEKINLITTALIGMGTVSILSSISNLAVNIGNLAMSLKMLAPYAAILSSLASIGLAAEAAGTEIGNLVYGTNEKSMIESFMDKAVGSIMDAIGFERGFGRNWFYGNEENRPNNTTNTTNNSGGNMTQNIYNFYGNEKSEDYRKFITPMPTNQ